MPVRWLTPIVALTASVACAQVTEYDFTDGGLEPWQPVVGEWSVREGALYQADASSPEYRYILAPDAWQEGSIETEATPLTVNRNGNVGASFGFMVKHIDANRWCAMRWGSYGGISLLIRDVEGQTVKLGQLQSVPGETRRVKMLLRGGYLAVVFDGIVQSILQDPFAGEPGRPGLFTETECRFDNVRIERIR